MIESIINPARTERGPIKLFFVGIVFASISLLFVQWFFSSDPVLSKYSGILVVTFCVMFTFPYLYYLIKQEEREDEEIEGFMGVWRVHKDAIFAFMWLFLGFIIAFSFWNIVLDNSNLFDAQLRTYCMINDPKDIEGCVSQYTQQQTIATGAATKEMRFLSIIENNVYVMIFTLLFSLVFGAGALFILAWNASVIALAIGVFTNYEIAKIPLGIARYMIHGLPEITAYFITALAGGIIGTGVIRKQIKERGFLRVIENSFTLLFFAIIILIFAALIEVYLTPVLFN